MRQGGFILGGTALLYAGIAAAVVVGGMGIALKVQSARLESCQDKFEAFKLQTKALGDAAEAERKRIDALNLKAKEKADAAHKSTVARLNRDVKRLRDANASRSAVPDAPAGSSRPHLACFDRAELDRAVSGFIAEVTELVGEGAAATVDLDAAKVWVKSVYE